MHTIDWIVIGVYLIILFSIIKRSHIKSQTMTGFAIDNQRATSAIIFASLSASFIGPGYTIGIAEKGYTDGFLYLFIYAGFTLQTILIGMFVAPKLRKYIGAFTVGDIIGYHYGKIARLLTGMLSLLFCAGIVGIVARVSGLLLQSTINVPFVLGVTISALIVVGYSSLGGMRTVVYSDIFQFIMLSIALSALLISIYIQHPDMTIIMNSLPDQFSHPFQSIGLFPLLGLFMGFFLGETLVPPYTNRAFVSKDAISAKQGFIYSGGYSLLWFSMAITVGIFARATAPEMNADASFLYMVVNYLPIGLLGLMIAGILSIVMSTQDSYLNAASVSFVRDIYDVFITKTVSDKKNLRLSKLITLFIGILGIIFAINAPGIVDALLINYSLWAPTVVLPVILGVLMGNKVKPISGLTAIILGGITTAFWKWGLENPMDIPALLPGIAANQLGFWICQIFVKNNSKHPLLKPSSGCTQLAN